MMTTSSTAQIRQKLDMAFDDSNLSAFCLDYYPKVYDRFSQGMRKDDKITLLLDYCRRNPTGFEAFRDNVRKEYKTSNFQSEQLKPLIDALSVYMVSSFQIAGTTKDGTGSGKEAHDSRITRTEPKLRERMTTSSIGHNKPETNHKREINISGGSYFEGNSSGQIIGGNYYTQVGGVHGGVVNFTPPDQRPSINIGTIPGSSGFAIGPHAQSTLNQQYSNHDLAKQFAQIYNQITMKLETFQEVLEVLKDSVKSIEEEVAKGQQANVKKIEGKLTLLELAPEILEMTANILINPVYGLGTSIQMVAKAKKTKLQSRRG